MLVELSVNYTVIEIVPLNVIKIAALLKTPVFPGEQVVPALELMDAMATPIRTETVILHVFATIPLSQLNITLPHRVLLPGITAPVPAVLPLA